MTDLSPQAQAVLDAFLTQWDVYAVDDARWAIAAALRAAVDQAVPEQSHEDAFEYCCDYAQSRTEDAIRHRLLAIVTELENH